MKFSGSYLDWVIESQPENDSLSSNAWNILGGKKEKETQKKKKKKKLKKNFEGNN